jgi:hypothetical protein
MTTIIRHLAAAAVLAAGLTAAAPDPALAQARNAAPGPYVHQGTGVALPLAVGRIERTRITEYDEARGNVSAGYRVEGLRGAMTVYLYPASGQTCRQWFDDADAAVTNNKGVARSADASPLTLIPAQAPEQFTARYTIPPNTFGGTHPELASLLWVGCTADGKWAVKLRSSFETPDERKMAELAQTLFAGIDWSPLTPR